MLGAPRGTGNAEPGTQKGAEIRPLLPVRLFHHAWSGMTSSRSNRI
jgi:hypothetical protein